ncbi:MAG: hypothetical protein RIB67_01730 [Miltoncostaeaceae bacterium]
MKNARTGGALVAAALATGALLAGPATAAPTVNETLVRAIGAQSHILVGQINALNTCVDGATALPPALQRKAQRIVTRASRVRLAMLNGVGPSQATRVLARKRNVLRAQARTVRVAANRCVTLATAGTPVAPLGEAATTLPVDVPELPALPEVPVTPPNVHLIPDVALPVPPLPVPVPEVPALPGVPDVTPIVAPVQLLLSDVLLGRPIDLGTILGAGAVLPPVLSLVDLGSLTGLVPGLPGVPAVPGVPGLPAIPGLDPVTGLLALDAASLLAVVQDLVAGALACAPLDLTCLIGGVTATATGLASTVTGLLDGVVSGAAPAGLGELLSVERLSDTVIQLVPAGALADLLALLDAQGALDGIAPGAGLSGSLILDASAGV